MARMNISISDELREEMDELHGVNWSEVARDAFDREVRKHRRVDPMDRRAIAERLRASYEEQRDLERQDGQESGAEWAAQFAEFSELRALSRMGEAASDTLFEWSVEDTPFDNHNRQEFWEGVTGDMDFDLTEEYVEGFVAGALDLWQKVKGDVLRK